MKNEISIVTPSYNQGHFIRETISSVLDQDYGKLQYIVIDGGSNDSSLSIIKEYASQLHYYVSEPDNGQADALNKGFLKASGDICAYLNSDDLLLPGSLAKVVKAFSDPKIQWVVGSIYVGESLETASLWKPSFNSLAEFTTSSPLPQQGVFWRKDALYAPYFDVSYQYMMDHAFFVRLAEIHGKPYVINEPLAFFRLHPGSKTSTLNSVLAMEAEIQIQQAITRATPSHRKAVIHHARIRAYQHQLASISTEWTTDDKRSFSSLKNLLFLLLKNPAKVFQRYTISTLKKMLLLGLTKP